MDLSEIISISGKPGLFKVVGQMKNGVIVESMEDGKRFPAMATHKISSLGDISIYCEEEDIPLADVLIKVKATNNSKPASVKLDDAEALKKFLATSLPKYDRDRVYVSDIKKLAKWYNILLAANLIIEEKKEDEKAKKTTKAKKAKSKKESTAKNTEAKKPKAKKKTADK